MSDIITSKEELTPFQTNQTFARVECISFTKKYFDKQDCIRYSESFFDNGNVYEQLPFDENGAFHGVVKFHGYNGGIKREIPYIHGIQHGISINSYNKKETRKEYYLKDKEVPKAIWWLNERGSEFLKDMFTGNFKEATELLFGQNKNDVIPKEKDMRSTRNKIAAWVSKL